MILTDYLNSMQDITWAFAKQCGINHAVIRLPEGNNFDVCNEAHWKSIYQKFLNFGIKPVVLEPLPNELHDHIKAGDERRDECIEKVIRMLPIMDSLDIRTICFNFMARVGWCRTDNAIKERGGALVSGFCMKDYKGEAQGITEQELWGNYTCFIKEVMPWAKRYGIRFALHPDDPPVPKLGNVSRIMNSYENIKKAMRIGNSNNLGITMCQACYYLMGENLSDVISEMKEKVFFIHFRNVTGNRYNFRETFHDNGDINMKECIRLYLKNKIDVPIRVDHVPAMEGERASSGYTTLGRLYAVGYLKGRLGGEDSIA